ncbi:Hypothetical predicted protein [Paramuricea clavata]|uniref:Uncharacterized protein n=1 Tax=Paramuricea clavata TaxID=317549 RepID=A0A6S7FVA1_PARCT|nr:Hypothetical predicted protein [Paramuricea clavata]
MSRTNNTEEVAQVPRQGHDANVIQQLVQEGAGAAISQATPPDQEMENKSSSDIESFFKEKNLSDVSEIFKENDIDGIALSRMMKEEHKCCLKELIAKMGPRLRAIDVIEKEYGKKTVKHGPSRDSNKVENVAFKGQMKIQMEGGV